MIQLNAIQLSDPDAERVRQSHALAIKEWQSSPAGSLTVIRNVFGFSNTDIVVPHPLGRAPIFVGISAVRVRDQDLVFVAPGVIVESITSALPPPIDRTRWVVLALSGFTSGAAVQLTFDVLVM